MREGKKFLFWRLWGWLKFMRLCVCVFIFTASCQKYSPFFTALSFNEGYSMLVHFCICVCVFIYSTCKCLCVNTWGYFWSFAKFRKFKVLSVQMLESGRMLLCYVQLCFKYLRVVRARDSNTKQVMFGACICVCALLSAQSW